MTTVTQKGHIGKAGEHGETWAGGEGEIMDGLRRRGSWEPDNPLKCKVTNVAITLISISKRVPVATVYSVNNFDAPRIQSFLKPLHQTRTGDERNIQNMLERQAESRESAPTEQPG